MLWFPVLFNYNGRVCQDIIGRRWLKQLRSISPQTPLVMRMIIVRLVTSWLLLFSVAVKSGGDVDEVLHVTTEMRDVSLFHRDRVHTTEAENSEPLLLGQKKAAIVSSSLTAWSQPIAINPFPDSVIAIRDKSWLMKVTRMRQWYHRYRNGV